MLPERHDLAWADHTHCANQPSSTFYVERGRHSADAALTLCNNPPCPARRQCLAYAIANQEEYGIWGGMAEHARRPLSRTRCPDCRALLGRPTIADLITTARQHIRCPSCSAWVEVRPDWERPHRNSHVTNGPGRRT